MGHFYSKDGKPQFTVIGKNGKERDSTIKDARENGWLPSVTTILQILDKPTINTWIQSQSILAALTLPRLPDESLDDFVLRVQMDSRKHSEDAKRFGTTIHACIESFLTSKPLPCDLIYDDKVKATWDNFRTFILDHNMVGNQCEVIKVNDKYCGTIDCLGKFLIYDSIIDFKTQGTKENKPVIFYPEWIYQLAAYSQLCNLQTAKHVSIVISSTDPKRVEYKIWEQDEVDRGLKIFNLACDLFYSIKNL